MGIRDNLPTRAEVRARLEALTATVVRTNPRNHLQTCALAHGMPGGIDDAGRVFWPERQNLPGRERGCDAGSRAIARLGVSVGAIMAFRVGMRERGSAIRRVSGAECRQAPKTSLKPEVA
jgi:hypothetical protein